MFDTLIEASDVDRLRQLATSTHLSPEQTLSTKTTYLKQKEERKQQNVHCCVGSLNRTEPVCSEKKHNTYYDLVSRLPSAKSALKDAL